MSGKEAFPILPVGGNIMSQMDFSAWPWQPSLKFTRAGSFWRLRETDASTPSCAVSLHHRFKPQSLQDFKPLWRLSALHWNLHSPFIIAFLGIHKQTRSTAQSTQSSALLQPFDGNKRFSTSCPSQKAECGQAVVPAEAGGMQIYEGCRDPRKGGTSRHGDTTEEVTDTNQIWAKQVSERPTLSIPQHLSKSTKYHKTILTTESIQCPHTTPPLAEQIPEQAGCPLKEDQAWGTWNTLFKLKCVNLRQCLWNTTLCSYYNWEEQWEIRGHLRLTNEVHPVSHAKFFGGSSKARKRNTTGTQTTYVWSSFLHYVVVTCHD